MRLTMMPPVKLHLTRTTKPSFLLMLLFTVSLLACSVTTIVANELALVKVTDTIWSITGPLSGRSPENFGNNATFGFVVTNEGVVLIDSGGSFKGANAIHSMVKSVTDQPVKIVINTGGQDHRWFGNDYFSKLGATIISSEAAKVDHKDRFDTQFTRLSMQVGDDGVAGTNEKYADITFANQYTLELGGIKFELYHRGQAHTPGDVFVWMPDKNVMFAGDIVYLQRILGVGEQSASKSWIETFNAMAAFNPGIIVPGHGSPAPLATAKKDTLDYLLFLRENIGVHIDEGKDLSTIGTIDQQAFSYLDNFESLSGRNANKVFREMEWE